MLLFARSDHGAEKGDPKSEVLDISEAAGNSRLKRGPEEKLENGQETHRQEGRDTQPIFHATGQSHRGGSHVTAPESSGIRP
jgi:hypothetical protein